MLDSYSVRVKASAAVVALAAVLALPGGAVAARCAPPGTSGVSQYYETVPGAGCNFAPGSGGGHGGSLPPGSARRLAAQGAAGRAVEQFIAGNAPALPRTSTPHGRSRTGVPTPAANRVPSAHGASPLSALLHPLLHGTGAGGTGVLLPVLFGAALAIALAVGARVAVRRRRLSS